MEKHGGPLGKSASVQALPLFAASAPGDEPEPDEFEPLYAALNQMNPDNMSPKQALDALYHLKTLAAGCADEAT
jgi:DNA mismatch repair protein MutS